MTGCTTVFLFIFLEGWGSCQWIFLIFKLLSSETRWIIIKKEVRLKHKTVLFVAFVDSSKNSVSYIFIFVMGPFEEVQQISHLSISSVSTQTLCFIMTPYSKTFLYALFIVFLTFTHFFSASVSVSSSWPAHWSAKWAAQEPWRVVNLQRWELFLTQTQGKKS